MSLLVTVAVAAAVAAVALATCPPDGVTATVSVYYSDSHHVEGTDVCVYLGQVRAPSLCEDADSAVRRARVSTAVE